MPSKKTSQGFTRSEWLIIILVFFALIGVMYPVLHVESTRADINETVSELRRIAEGTFAWIRDSQPHSEKDGPEILAGPGILPANASKRVADLAEALETRQPKGVFMGKNGEWKGPYTQGLNMDPWGRAFVLVGLEKGQEHLWLLSGGPDGKLETTHTHQSLVGDDIGFRLR